ncbi:hypothetical protein [Polyangium aurulentum]|uniref:hypothetical protein n=1 Tax=Polyangium aurulentum TaxID=2567896 RepID=UPI0010AE23CA|nr:hypothetical protein [Polyangium aurulentum]UQA54953.1 hypothetical protein E8A73_026725 [Polyangium aurulentum]
MRVGILGPAKGDLAGLARAARMLLDDAQVDKVIYLADDGALDAVVRTWARTMVGGNPSEEALFMRAAARCAEASPEAIDAFVTRERARERLRVLTSLPEGSRRTIEFLDNRVILFVYDRAILDEEDIVAASVLVFGRSVDPQMKRIGSRVFVAPGRIGWPGAGCGVLDDEGGGGLRIEIRGIDGAVTVQETMGGGGPLLPGIKMRVQGGKSSG